MLAASCASDCSSSALPLGQPAEPSVQVSGTRPAGRPKTPNATSDQTATRRQSPRGSAHHRYGTSRRVRTADTASRVRSTALYGAPSASMSLTTVVAP